MQPSPELSPRPATRDPQPSLEKLKKVMSRISQEVNAEVAKKYGVEQLVDDSLHIDLAHFSRKKGGIYKKEDIDADKKKVDDLDLEHSGVADEKVQKFYKEKHKLQGDVGSEEIKKEILALFRENKEANKGSQAEMVITALLHKVLKERFLVVRSSVFDDYTHGIDNFILDKETGAVICAFDEVIENEGDKARGESGKAEKIKKIAMKGGTEAKYGVSLTEGKIVRSAVENIPVFYLTLESKDLNELTNDLFYSKDGTRTDAEQKLFSHLVHSIKEQKGMLEALNLPPVMKEKLQSFETSLTALMGYAEGR
jgi:hypothetical protein